MSAHDLRVYTLGDIVDSLAGVVPGRLETAVADLLEQWGSVDSNPFSNQAQVISTLIRGIRAQLIKSRVAAADVKFEPLSRVVDENSSKRLGHYIGITDGATIADVLKNNIVVKGMLFTTQTAPGHVFFHPDKDYTPVSANAIHRTGHSIAGRRQRRRDTRPK